MAAVLREIIIDCNDPRRVAEFWGQVLGWDLQEHHGVPWASESGDWRDLCLVFVQVPDRKSAKNRIHLDVSPVGCDRDDEVARLVILGAQRRSATMTATPAHGGGLPAECSVGDNLLLAMRLALNRAMVAVLMASTPCQ